MQIDRCEMSGFLRRRPRSLQHGIANPTNQGSNTGLGGHSQEKPGACTVAPEKGHTAWNGFAASMPLKADCPISVMKTLILDRGMTRNVML
jgi:hypothetical protein